MLFWIFIHAIILCGILWYKWISVVAKATPSVRGDVLLVFAHPDDEAMFFSPLLWYLKQKGLATHFLCLSTGNYDGLGAIREKELLLSAAYFGVHKSHVKIVDHPSLQDGMRNTWPSSLVAQEVLMYLQTAGTIGTVITFDEYGVSGHANHMATHYGVQEAKRRMPPGIIFLQLRTRGLLAKYSGFLSVGWFLLFSRLIPHERRHFVLISPPTCVLTSWNAMRLHTSQLVWFRYLFVMFSSYSFVNEFSDMPQR